MVSRRWIPYKGVTNAVHEGNLGDSYASSMILYEWHESKRADVPFVTDNRLYDIPDMATDVRHENIMSFTAASGNRWIVAKTSPTIHDPWTIISVNATTDVIGLASGATVYPQNGDPVMFSGTLPGGVDTICTYYLRYVSDRVYTLHSSYHDAMTGSSKVNITTTATGGLVQAPTRSYIICYPLDGQNDGKRIKIAPMVTLNATKTGEDMQMLVTRRYGGGNLSAAIATPCIKDTATTWQPVGSFTNSSSQYVVSNPVYCADDGKLWFIAGYTIGANTTGYTNSYYLYCLHSVDLLADVSGYTPVDIRCYGVDEVATTDTSGYSPVYRTDAAGTVIGPYAPRHLAYSLGRMYWDGYRGQVYQTMMAPLDGNTAGFFNPASADGADSTGYTINEDTELLRVTTTLGSVAPVENIFAFGTDDPITAFRQIDDRLYIFRKFSIWKLTGMSSDIGRADAFDLRMVSNQIGTKTLDQTVENAGSIYFLTNGGIYQIKRDDTLSKVQLQYDLPKWSWVDDGTLRGNLSVYSNTAILFQIAPWVWYEDKGAVVGRAWIISEDGGVSEYPIDTNNYHYMFHRAITGNTYVAKTTPTLGDGESRTSETEVFHQQSITSPLYGAYRPHRINKIVLSYSGLLDSDNPISALNLIGYYLDIMPEEDVGTAPEYTALQTYDLSKCVAGNSVAVISPKSTYSRYRIRIRSDNTTASPKTPIRIIGVDIDYEHVISAPMTKFNTDLTKTKTALLSPTNYVEIPSGVYTTIASGGPWSRIEAYVTFNNKITGSGDIIQFYYGPFADFRYVTLYRHKNLTIATVVIASVIIKEMTIKQKGIGDFYRIQIADGTVLVDGIPMGSFPNSTVSEIVVYYGTLASSTVSIAELYGWQ